MKVAVIGAGWAGLAAAAHLLRSGHEPWVFEAAREIGGRARAVAHAGLGTVVDCGQHILLGAYHETLSLMRAMGVDPQHALHEQPLRVISADRRFRVGTWPLPAPAHGLGIVLGGRGLSWAERYQLAHTLYALIRPTSAPQAGDTVSLWLMRLGASSRLCHQLWNPLCLAALNTPADLADARLFLRVLRESLGVSARASRLLIPRQTLNDLWPARAQAQLPGLRLGHRVRTLARTPQGRYEVDGQTFDAVVVATPPPEALRLLRLLPSEHDWLKAWPDWRYEGIGTVSLRLERPWGSGQAMSLLDEHPEQVEHGQWLFDRSAITNDDEAHLVHVVISGASRYADRPSAEVIDGVIRQIRTQARRALPAITARALITERRATFSALPGLRRPGTHTPWPGLVLAGDWTDTGYPAVLEGAALSGRLAAQALDAGQSGPGNPPPAAHRNP